jgi:hypothetical protein
VIVTAARPLVDEATSKFVQNAVSIFAASTNPQNHPTIARAVGCRVSRDRRRVTVLVSSKEPFVEAVRATRAIAVTFTQPGTHATIQLKGKDAKVTSRRKDDPELMTRYTEAFIADVCPLGYSEELLRALLGCDPAEVSAVTFCPHTAFLQTPGPRAGTPLKP